MEIINLLFVVLATFLVPSDKKLVSAKEALLVFNEPVFSSHVQERMELIKNQRFREETEDLNENLEKIIYSKENDECKENHFECTPKDAVLTTKKQPATTPTGVTAAGERSTPGSSHSTTTEAETSSYPPSETTPTGNAAGESSTPGSSDSTTTEAETPSYPPSETTPTGNDCKSGWSAYNNSCYLFVQTEKIWEDAKNECSSHNSDAHLVFIESDTENDFVIHLIQDGSYATDEFSDVWLGLTYDWNEGIWKWDNTEADIPDEGPRALLIGSSPDECVRIQTSNNFKWNDKECSESYFFICEILARQT